MFTRMVLLSSLGLLSACVFISEPDVGADSIWDDPMSTIEGSRDHCSDSLCELSGSAPSIDAGMNGQTDADFPQEHDADINTDSEQTDSGSTPPVRDEEIDEDIEIDIDTDASGANASTEWSSHHVDIENIDD